MAKIFVNGEAKDISLPLNITGVVKQLLVENPEMVLRAIRWISSISWVAVAIQTLWIYKTK